MSTPAVARERLRNQRHKSDLVLAAEAARRTPPACRCRGTRVIAIGDYDEHRRFTGTRLVPCPICRRSA